MLDINSTQLARVCKQCLQVKEFTTMFTNNMVRIMFDTVWRLRIVRYRKVDVARHQNSIHCNWSHTHIASGSTISQLAVYYLVGTQSHVFPICRRMNRGVSTCSAIVIHKMIHAHKFRTIVFTSTSVTIMRMRRFFSLIKHISSLRDH